MLRRRMRSERGAAAVEFALVVPILIVLVFGIAEFGRACFIQSNHLRCCPRGCAAQWRSPIRQWERR